MEQWQALVAVVDADGYARAAEKLHKSQSAVTYAVQKLERLLDVKAFEIRGRKAVLTPTGQMLYQRARSIVEAAAGLERAAKRLDRLLRPAHQQQRLPDPEPPLHATVRLRVCA